MTLPNYDGGHWTPTTLEVYAFAVHGPWGDQLGVYASCTEPNYVLTVWGIKGLDDAPERPVVAAIRERRDGVETERYWTWVPTTTPPTPRSTT